jgi:hypothetical protein
VITVEPPAAGDRIRTLQREFQPYLAGAIFVRRQGRTVPALPGDIQALEDRFAEPFVQAERHRQRLRLEKIGEAVEELFSEVEDANPSARPPSTWYRPVITFGLFWWASRTSCRSVSRSLMRAQPFRPEC